MYTAVVHVDYELLKLSKAQCPYIQIRSSVVVLILNGYIVILNWSMRIIINIIFKWDVDR